MASAAAQDGTVDAAAVKFVRHQKTTMIELQRRAAEKAQQILEKQVPASAALQQCSGRITTLDMFSVLHVCAIPIH